MFRQYASVVAFRVKPVFVLLLILLYRGRDCLFFVLLTASLFVLLMTSLESSFSFFSSVAAAMLLQADRQRKHNKFLNLPGGGRVPYDQDAPDLTLDLANIEGRYARDTAPPS